MKCRRWEKLIQKKLDGRLTDREGSALAAHLEACPQCREALGDYEGIARGLAAQAHGEEVRLSSEVMARIREEGRFFRIRPLAVAAAAAVAVIGLGILFALRKGEVGTERNGSVTVQKAASPEVTHFMVVADFRVPDLLEDSQRACSENVRTLRMDVVTTKEALAKAFTEIARDLPLI